MRFKFLFKGVEWEEDEGAAVKVGPEVLRGFAWNEIVALLAVIGMRGAGSSSDESNETPLDGGWDESLFERASILDSSVDMESRAC